jgi:hypothetical protein
MKFLKASRHKTAQRAFPTRSHSDNRLAFPYGSSFEPSNRKVFVF